MPKTKQMLDRLMPDYDRVVGLVDRGSRVLDLGCGEGCLLERLIKERGAHGFGVEIDGNNIVECVGRGLSVFQGNIDEGLSNYPDNFYDFVILNQTLQVTHKPDYVLKEMLRVGEKVVVSFPNFAYWKIRLKLFFAGKMPKSEFLPFEWYNTPNIHLLSITDFRCLCREKNWVILKEIFISGKANVSFMCRNIFPNLFAEEAIFVLSRKDRL